MVRRRSAGSYRGLLVKRLGGFWTVFAWCTLAKAPRARLDQQWLCVFLEQPSQFPLRVHPTLEADAHAFDIRRSPDCIDHAGYPTGQLLIELKEVPQRCRVNG